MHDELGQLLTAVKMNITYLIRLLKKDGIAQKPDELFHELEGISSTVDKSVKGVRQLITKLRPEILDNLGLFPAIEWLAEDFRKKTGKSATVENRAGEPELGKDISLALFRIVQECLTNVIKHADANQVRISFSREGNFYELAVSDDGKGFRAEGRKTEKKFGIMGIRERMYIFGGDVSVKSSIGSGTVITVRLPLKDAIAGKDNKKELL
jgi:signal transduction histidine kinase